MAEPQPLHPKGEEPIGVLLRELVSDFRDLVRSEIHLAKRETGNSVNQSVGAVIWLSVGTTIAFLGAAFLLLCAVFALSNIMAPWAAALIVGGVVFVIGAIVTLIAYNRMKQISFVPEETVESLKEDQEWLSRQKP